MNNVQSLEEDYGMGKEKFKIINEYITLMIAKPEDSLQQVLDTFNQGALEHSKLILVSRTKVMTRSKEPLRSFNYLNITVSTDKRYSSKNTKPSY